MTFDQLLHSMPKVELHVHLEGAIPPDVLLTVAKRNGVALPVSSPEACATWYTFRTFSEFVRIYLTVSECIQTPDDIELIARAFLAHQAAQNICYSEVTFTAITHYHFRGIPFTDQLAALQRARAWARHTLNTDMGIVLDIPRPMSAAQGEMVANWAIDALGEGVVALGLAGHEAQHPAERFRHAFSRAHAAGVPIVPHAGETDGAASIWDALTTLHARRIGHGIRCLEDDALVAELVARQVPLEVCVSSNVALGVVADWAHHPLPRLLDAGLYITINTDDPALFDTTLTAEYERIGRVFHVSTAQLVHLAHNAIKATLLPTTQQETLATALHEWCIHHDIFYT